MIEAPYVLERAAGMGLLGESTVRFELHLAAGGTQVSIIETPRKGLAAFAARQSSEDDQLPALPDVSGEVPTGTAV